MSVPDITLFNNLAFSLDNTNGLLQTLEQQMGTGKRVNQPSDDPAAYAQSELLTQQQAVVTNDVSMASSIQNRMNSIDGALAATGDALNTAIQDATEGANGTLTASQMAALGNAVGGLLSQVIGAANFQYGGSYVFGGNQVQAPPYDPTGNYLGDTGTNAAHLSDGTAIQLTFNGQAVFGNPTTGVIGDLTALQTALNSGNQAGVAATLNQLQADIASIAQVRSQVGAASNLAAAEVNNGNNNIVNLTSSISAATNLDVVKAAAQLQELNLQEQALVSVGTDLGRIPLINVLA